MHQRIDSARRSSLTWWAVAFCCWIAFIWGHSLIQGPQSSLESGFVVSMLSPLFEAVGILDVDFMTLIVRKGAHFTEYAILGVLTWGLFRALGRERGRRAFPTALLVALVPILDELLQLFVPGRSGRLTDVLIDLSGICFGALVACALSWLRKRRV